MSQQPIQKTMSDGTLETQEKKRPGRPKTIKATTTLDTDVKLAQLESTTEMYDSTKAATADLISSLRDLEYRVALADSQGVRELETTPELMSQLLKAQYAKGERSIVYKNVRLFEVGTKDAILAKENVTITQKLHGHGRLKL